MKKKNKLFVVWGGQFGSEGKGQIAAYLTKRGHVDRGVRVGGPNAGHTFYYPNGLKGVVQTIPVPAMLGKGGYIGPAGLFLLDIMKRELVEGFRATGMPVTLLVDKNAVIITEEHMAAEGKLKGRIGSTGEGVGAATAEKVWRRPEVVVNHESNRKIIMEALDPGADEFSKVVFGVDTVGLMNMDLIAGRNLLIEGTQGYGLSLHTGGYYPFCTSRECTPWGLIAQTGVNPTIPWTQMESIMVIRTYPIRVGGNSGDLPNEVDWDFMRKKTEGYIKDPEITTVTKKVRRIAKLDMKMLSRAVTQCGPTALALTFFDYEFPELAGALSPEVLKKNHWKYINDLEKSLGVPVKFLSTGPGSTMSLRATY